MTIRTSVRTGQGRAALRRTHETNGDTAQFRLTGERLGPLLWFDGEIGVDPFVPAALEGINFGVSLFHKMPCHPGTGRFVMSGAVKDQGFILWVLLHP